VEQTYPIALSDVNLESAAAFARFVWPAKLSTRPDEIMLYQEQLDARSGNDRRLCQDVNRQIGKDR
jgi:hypothetical protein